MQQYISLITYRIISFYIHTSKQFFVVMLYYLTIHTRTKIKKSDIPLFGYVIYGWAIWMDGLKLLQESYIIVLAAIEGANYVLHLI